MPEPRGRLSPLTYTTIPVWASLVSCPRDCKGYRNRTLAKIRNRVVSWFHWSSNPKQSHVSQGKAWWERPIGIAALGILIAVISGLIVWAITRHYDRSSPSMAPSAGERPKAPPQSEPQGQRTPSPQKAAGEKVTKLPQDNSVHLGKGSKIEQQSSGNCSPNIIGGASTVNCVPQAQIPDSKVDSLSAQLALCSSGSTIASPAVINPSALTEKDAQNLASAFSKAHVWRYSGVSHTIKGQDMGPDGPIPDPVGIHILSDDNHQSLAICVRDALKSTGVESVIEPPKQPQGDALSIVVGNPSQ